MRPEEILAFLRRQPFEAFRMHLTDGTTYEVRHRDQCILTRSAIYVAMPGPYTDYAPGLGAYALIHINRLEPLTAGQPT